MCIIFVCFLLILFFFFSNNLFAQLSFFKKITEPDKSKEEGKDLSQDTIWKSNKVQENITHKHTRETRGQSPFKLILMTLQSFRKQLALKMLSILFIWLPHKLADIEPHIFEQKSVYWTLMPLFLPFSFTSLFSCLYCWVLIFVFSFDISNCMY